MKRLAPALFALSLVAVAAPASADLGAISVMYGGSVSEIQGERTWQPTLWIDMNFAVAGPLHLGGYVQFLGESFPLDDPGAGGGFQVALRGEIKKKFRLTGAFNVGYLKVPIGNSEKEGAATISAFGAFGYAFLSWMAIETRFRWINYFKMSDGAPSIAWNMEGGFTFYID